MSDQQRVSDAELSEECDGQLSPNIELIEFALDLQEERALTGRLRRAGIKLRSEAVLNRAKIEQQREALRAQKAKTILDCRMINDIRETEEAIDELDTWADFLTGKCLGIYGSDVTSDLDPAEMRALVARVLSDA